MSSQILAKLGLADDDPVSYPLLRTQLPDTLVRCSIFFQGCDYVAKKVCHYLEHMEKAHYCGNSALLKDEYPPCTCSADATFDEWLPFHRHMLCHPVKKGLPPQKIPKLSSAATSALEFYDVEVVFNGDLPLAPVQHEIYPGAARRPPKRWLLLFHFLRMYLRGCRRHPGINAEALWGELRRALRLHRSRQIAQGSYADRIANARKQFYEVFGKNDRGEVRDTMLSRPPSQIPNPPLPPGEPVFTLEATAPVSKTAKPGFGSAKRRII